MQSRIKHLLKHFALVLKAKLNQLKPFVRFVFQSSTLPHPHIHRIIKGLHIQTLFMLLYASFSCPYNYWKNSRIDKKKKNDYFRQKKKGMCLSFDTSPSFYLGAFYFN